MSGPAGVLAVLDSLIEYHDTSDSLKGRNCIAARAAVADLYRLVLSIDEECSNAKPNFGRVVKLAAEAAALARVGGAK